MDDQSRLELLKQGHILTSSDLFKQEENLKPGGLRFIIRHDNGRLEYAQVFKPNPINK